MRLKDLLESERETACSIEDDKQDLALLAKWDESEEGEEYAKLKAFLEE